MLDAETSAEIRRLYYAEHWKIGTIGTVKGVHPDAVRRALSDPGVRGQTRTVRAKITDPFLPFIRETLEKYPRLRATRLYQMRKAGTLVHQSPGTTGKQPRASCTTTRHDGPLPSTNL